MVTDVAVLFSGATHLHHPQVVEESVVEVRPSDPLLQESQPRQSHRPQPRQVPAVEQLLRNQSQVLQKSRPRPHLQRQTQVQSNHRLKKLPSVGDVLRRVRKTKLLKKKGRKLNERRFSEIGQKKKRARIKRSKS